jgi:hypothetical protein
MKFFLSVIVTSLLAFIAGIYLPWWSIAIVAFAVALVMQLKISSAFLSAFIGIFLLWCLIAVWIDIKNGSLLSNKIAQLFPLGGSSVLLIIVTGLIGGLVAGFAAMAGASISIRHGIKQ